MHLDTRFSSPALSILVVSCVAVLGSADAHAQVSCDATPIVSGLTSPLGIAQSSLGNLIVSETGAHGVLHSGRISIVDRRGGRRTLVDGLPSGTNDVNEPSGPAGVFMRGRTLYVAIGIGDAILPGPLPGTALANPLPSSPIFSSVLALRFSTHVERMTAGFSLTTADQLALSAGERVRLSNGDGDRLTIKLVANFPDFVSEPRPDLAENVRGSNPFDLVVDDDRAYVTDGGRNLVWHADIHSGRTAPLATFATTPNPMFPGLGGPSIEAVPTGIAQHDGRLLVTLFRGFPFPTGASSVESINPDSGRHRPFISGLTSAIDILPLASSEDDDGEDSDPRAYLVLQHASGDVLSGDGSLIKFERESGEATPKPECLHRPTSMVRDRRSRRVYVTEIVDGRIVVIR